MKELATLRFERERQPIISKCIEEIRQELKKYDCIRSASQPIDEIEKKKPNKQTRQLRKKKKKLSGSKDVEDNKEKLKTVGGDLVEINDRIIRSYDISYDWCPKFFRICAGIILFSKMIREELIKQGISRLLGKSSAGKDDDSE